MTFVKKNTAHLQQKSELLIKWRTAYSRACTQIKCLSACSKTTFIGTSARTYTTVDVTIANAYSVNQLRHRLRLICFSQQFNLIQFAYGGRETESETAASCYETEVEINRRVYYVPFNHCVFFASSKLTRHAFYCGPTKDP